MFFLLHVPYFLEKHYSDYLSPPPPPPRPEAASCQRRFLAYEPSPFEAHWTENLDQLYTNYVRLTLEARTRDEKRA